MRVFAVIVGLMTGCFSTAQPRAPIPEPAVIHVSEGRLTPVLAEFVDRGGRIDYAGLRADRADLDAFVAGLASISPDSHPDAFDTTEERLTYWINAYNALAVLAVIDRPSLRSVADDKVGVFYWTRYPLGGAPTSLYALENNIIRKRFSEPRIHFALNCQSVGCPRMLNRAFSAVELDDQLQAATLEFVSDSAKVRVEGSTLYVSAIFDWYREDFESSGGIEAFIRGFRPDLPATSSIQFLDYDWALIDQAQ